MPLFADRSSLLHQILRESQNCTFHRNRDANGLPSLNSSLQSETKLCSYGCCEGSCCYPEHLSSIMWVSLTVFGTAAVLSALIIGVFYLCLMKRRKPKTPMATTPVTGLRDLQHRELYQSPPYCSCHHYVPSTYAPSTPAGPLALPPPPANYGQQYVATYPFKSVADPWRPVLNPYPQPAPFAYPSAPRAVPSLSESSLPPRYTLHEERSRRPEQIPEEAAAPAQVGSGPLQV